MMHQYGGVPMVMEPQALTDDLYVTHNKTSECINLIIQDLDEAIQDLPWKWTGDDKGLFSKATAMALKGRILLYIMPIHNLIRKIKRNAGKQLMPITRSLPDK